MDVGADNFRFTLEDKNGLGDDTVTAREPKTSELHVDSLDRYLPSDLLTTSSFLNTGSQTLAKVAGPILLPSTKSGTNFTIYNGRNLINGYFSRVALTQFNLNYRVPTVTTGVNDLLAISTFDGVTPRLRLLVIPQGYYTYATMATTVTTLMQAFAPELIAATCTAPNVLAPGANPLVTGFTWATNNPAVTMAFLFGGPGTGQSVAIRSAKTFRMFGMNRATFGYFPEFNAIGQPTTDPTRFTSAVGGPPNFLPTDYVDVVSQALSNYKDSKDTNSTIAAPGAVIGRIYLTECPLVFGGTTAGTPVDASVLGFLPLAFCKTWDNPNWSQWSPNQTITSLDFRLLDMWGDNVFWTAGFPTEWSATITLTE